MVSLWFQLSLSSQFPQVLLEGIMLLNGLVACPAIGSIGPLLCGHSCFFASVRSCFYNFLSAGFQPDSEKWIYSEHKAEVDFSPMFLRIASAL
jgi:hypothetical protein